MSAITRLAGECAALLEEAETLLEVVPQEAYERGARDCGGGIRNGGTGAGGVGAQLRHCLDCFSCFFTGMETGRVDYDLRSRETRAETDAAFAATVLRNAAAHLREEVAREPDREIEVRMDEPDLPAGEGWSRSSVARELRFLASHTLHHFALIAQGLTYQGVSVDPRFGLAPATAAFRRGDTTAIKARSAKGSG